MGDIVTQTIPTSAQARKIEGIGIHRAILEILREGKLYAQKTRVNEQQNYRYVGEADFLALLRPQLADHGIMVFPQYEVLKQDVFTTSKGTVMQTCTVRGRYNFVHVESQTGIIVETIGTGVDMQDKAPYKAMTGALKYAVRQLFLIETGDDPEQEVEDPTPQAPPPSKFMAALNEQKERLIGNNPKGYQRVLDTLAPDVKDFDAIPTDTKKAIIAALKAEPPF